MQSFASEFFYFLGLFGKLAISRCRTRKLTVKRICPCLDAVKGCATILVCHR
jgi:hypothetical protein